MACLQELFGDGGRASLELEIGRTSCDLVFQGRINSYDLFCKELFFLRFSLAKYFSLILTNFEKVRKLFWGYFSLYLSGGV